MSSAGSNQNIVAKLILEFYKGNLKYSLQDEDIKKLSWDKQNDFLDATVHSELLKKYPPSKDFTILFFKKLIQYLEPLHEVHDGLYGYLCSVIKNKQENSDIYYRHYVVGENLNNIITIKETKNIVVNGTTGMRTWEAALMIADWALCNKSAFNCKKVLELGSGVGFTGITIAKLCNPHSVMMTDCHNDVLSTICKNVEINFPDSECEENENETVFRDSEKTIGVKMLDWNQVEFMANDVAPDIILGADIIYDPTIISPLCKTIKFFLDRNKHIAIYIMNIIRNEDTTNQFLRTLESMNFEYKAIPYTRSDFLQWDENIKKLFIKIENKYLNK